MVFWGRGSVSGVGGEGEVEVEGSERQVEEGWRMVERRRIWERRKAVLRAGIVLEFDVGGSIVGGLGGG